MAKSWMLALLTCTVANGAPSDRPKSPAQKHELKPTLLPFHLNKDGMPLIDGAIDGTVGVFLFDTGNSMRFLLNRNFVPLGKGVEGSRGTFASGQVLSVQSHAGEHKAVLAGLIDGPASSGSRKSPEATMSIDARQQQENIDPRLLGWVGWGLFKDYVMTIDYVALKIRLDPIGTPTKVSGLSRSTAVLNFTPFSPVVPFFVNVGGHSTPAIIDTAGRDELALTAETWNRLAKTDAVRHGPGVQCVSIKAVPAGRSAMQVADLSRVERSEERLTLGVDFLRRFTSRWDPAAGTVTLVTNGTRRPAKPSCT